MRFKRKGKRKKERKKERNNKILFSPNTTLLYVYKRKEEDYFITTIKEEEEEEEEKKELLFSFSLSSDLSKSKTKKNFSLPLKDGKNFKAKRAEKRKRGGEFFFLSFFLSNALNR